MAQSLVIHKPGDTAHSETNSGLLDDGFQPEQKQNCETVLLSVVDLRHPVMMPMSVLSLVVFVD